MAGEGEKLRAARLAKGWGLADAEEETKIRIRYLQALEEENYDILPGAAYVKGFLRTYANHLGLNAEELLTAYKSSVTPEIPVYTPPIKPIRTRSVWFRPAVIVVMAVVAVVVVIAIGNLLSPPANTPSNNYQPPPMPNPQDNVLPDTPGTTNPPPTTVIPGNNTNPVIEGLVAQVKFTQRCWVRVKLDDGAAQDTMYQAGETKEIKANTKIEFVSIGNPAGMTITLNGKALPPFADLTKPVYNYVLTKETLNTLQ